MIKYLLLSMFAGSLLPLQVGANSVLAKDLNSPVTATVISMCVSLLAGIFLFFVTSESLPVSSALESIPLWAYMGGMASILFLYTSIISGPKIGAAGFFAVLIFGQYSVSLILDHFGVLGLPVHPATIFRVFGVFCILAGAILIIKK
jgi:transporter family-2 protein